MTWKAKHHLPSSQNLGSQNRSLLRVKRVQGDDPSEFNKLLQARALSAGRAIRDRWLQGREQRNPLQRKVKALVHPPLLNTGAIFTDALSFELGGKNTAPSLRCLNDSSVFEECLNECLNIIGLEDATDL
ncbi:hypothetical protein Hypma_014615 [Hypsizygus marmoreus]|uniref:Uncharacterized protein n=1 Tax=Hypsizygus marmoreus TaxID=39966 RepID=A0A369JA75_HYPMA|nr:hypothetical protein Hypma_014615 [Hypsizygus marmoreus]